jgi:hypothetical protein
VCLLPAAVLQTRRHHPHLVTNSFLHPTSAAPFLQDLSLLRDDHHVNMATGHNDSTRSTGFLLLLYQNPVSKVKFCWLGPFEDLRRFDTSGHSDLSVSVGPIHQRSKANTRFIKF